MSELDTDAAHIMELYERALNLESLKAGEGFDDIGRAFCDFLYQPRPLASTRAILAQACAVYPDFIEGFQRISDISEHLHEQWHADKLLNGEYACLDDLKDAYGYSWIDGKARAELALIPEKEGAKVHYYCGAMVPFSVMALKDLRPDLDITMIDNDKDRLEYSRQILDSDEAYQGVKTSFIDLENPDVLPCDIAFLIGARFQIPTIFSKLHKLGVSDVALNGAEGMCVLMYPELINVFAVEGYKFVKGFTPHHLADNLREGFSHLSDLSFLSLVQLVKI